MIPSPPTPPAPDWRAQAKGLVDRILATGGVGFYRSAIDAVADALAAAYTEGQRSREAELAELRDEMREAHAILDRAGIVRDHVDGGEMGLPLRVQLLASTVTPWRCNRACPPQEPGEGR